MSATFFNKNCVWMHLKSQEEIVYLAAQMKKHDFDGTIVSVTEQELPRLGRRLTVCIQQPGTKPDKNVHYLTGENYKKWEKIKRTIYSHRRDNEITEEREVTK